MADHPVTAYIPAASWALIKPHFSEVALDILAKLISKLWTRTSLMDLLSFVAPQNLLKKTLHRPNQAFWMV